MKSFLNAVKGKTAVKKKKKKADFGQRPIAYYKTFLEYVHVTFTVPRAFMYQVPIAVHGGVDYCCANTANRRL